MRGFRKFLTRGNPVDLAVAVVHYLLVAPHQQGHGVRQPAQSRDAARMPGVPEPVNR